MALHSSTLAWKIPWMEKSGRLQSTGSLRVKQLSDFTFTFHFHALEKEMANPLQCSCLENPRDGGAWWAAVYGVAQSRTRLKRLNSSSSTHSLCQGIPLKRTISIRYYHIQMGAEKQKIEGLLNFLCKAHGITSFCGIQLGLLIMSLFH